jgi:hypothetical protein
MSNEITPGTTLLELLDQGCDIILDDEHRIGRHGSQLFWLEGRTLYRNRGEVTQANVKRLLLEVRLAMEDQAIEQMEDDD